MKSILVQLTKSSQKMRGSLIPNDMTALMMYLKYIFMVGKNIYGL